MWLNSDSSSRGRGTVVSTIRLCMRKIGCLNPSRDKPNSLKQVVTAPLANAREQVWESRIFGNEHYKCKPRVTISVACQRTTGQWPRVPSIRQHLQPFIGDGDVSKWLKIFRVKRESYRITKAYVYHIRRISCFSRPAKRGGLLL